MLFEPNKEARSPLDASAIDAIAWWVAPAFAIGPALLIAALAGLVAAWTETLRSMAFVWGISAGIAVIALEIWHRITCYSVLLLSTTLTVAAIVGAFTGLIAALTGSSPADSGIRFMCSLAGALQGAAVAWLIVRPDIGAPKPDDEEHENEDDPPNPPTSPP